MRCAARCILEPNKFLRTLYVVSGIISTSGQVQSCKESSKVDCLLWYKKIRLQLSVEKVSDVFKINRDGDDDCRYFDTLNVIKLY